MVKTKIWLGNTGKNCLTYTDNTDEPQWSSYLFKAILSLKRLDKILSLCCQQYREAWSEIHRDRHHLTLLHWTALACKSLPSFIFNLALRPRHSWFRDWLDISLHVGCGEWMLLSNCFGFSSSFLYFLNYLYLDLWGFSLLLFLFSSSHPTGGEEVNGCAVLRCQLGSMHHNQKLKEVFVRNMKTKGNH